LSLIIYVNFSILIVFVSIIFHFKSILAINYLVSHLLDTIFNFLLNYVLLFLWQHVGLSTTYIYVRTRVLHMLNCLKADKVLLVSTCHCVMVSIGMALDFINYQRLITKRIGTCFKEERYSLSLYFNWWCYTFFFEKGLYCNTSCYNFPNYFY
jgi:hypothetical protein